MRERAEGKGLRGGLEGGEHRRRAWATSSLDNGTRSCLSSTRGPPGRAALFFFRGDARLAQPRQVRHNAPVAEAVPACGRALRGAAFVACVAFALLVLGYLHDRQWNAYDDGAYLHVADRMLHGEVLNRDVQDVHAGYINFANAGAMWLFGNDAVSPRYPLVAMGLVNAAVVFWLLAPYGTLASVAGSVATTCLSCRAVHEPDRALVALSLTLLTLVAMTRRPPATWAPTSSSACLSGSSSCSASSPASSSALRSCCTCCCTCRRTRPRDADLARAGIYRTDGPRPWRLLRPTWMRRRR